MAKKNLVMLAIMRGYTYLTTTKTINDYINFRTYHHRYQRSIFAGCSKL